MKIEDIEITPSNWKNHGMEPINMLRMMSRKLADLIRAMNNDTKLNRIEGRFILECKGRYQAHLTLETEDM
jgi:hypothetical protein